MIILLKNKLLSLTTAAAIFLCAAAGCSSDNFGPKTNFSADGQIEEKNRLVQPIEGLPNSFIKGMDISSIISMEQSGVVYYNQDGKIQDIFHTLADSGVNYIRVRVWNDPYDSDGNGYGGGNCDIEKAAEIGRRAAAYKMKLLVDFHYSDFWADPTRQLAPKAWANISFDEKKEALYNYTADSLNTLLDAGADVRMVQIGNEINNGLAGETDYEKVLELLKQGSRAVRAVSEERNCDIKISLHYTEINDYSRMMYYAKNLADAKVDYDIFGVSYYPFWHGSMENLTSVLKDISKNYGKQTAVLETSYIYTAQDGDGFANTVSNAEPVKGYTASVQGQAQCIRDVMAAAFEADAIGVFYWEGAWIPVGNNADYNKALWEKYGSGWASSFSTEYDPQNIKDYYGGSAWDNQALFDFTGHPLESLNVFKK